MKQPCWHLSPFSKFHRESPPQAWPVELTSSIVLVIIDEERDRIKHVFFSHVIPLRVVICFLDVIVLYTRVGLTSTNKTNKAIIEKQCLDTKMSASTRFPSAVVFNLSQG